MCACVDCVVWCVYVLCFGLVGGVVLLIVVIVFWFVDMLTMVVDL